MSEETQRSSRLGRFLHRQSVAQAAILLSTLSLASKFIGFAREVVIAQRFGATWQTDAFLVGMMVPNLVLSLVAGGLTTLIIPWYIGHKREDPERAKILVNQVAVVWGTVFALVCALVALFAPQLVHLFASGFTGQRLTLAIHVTRLLVPMGFMVIMSGLCTGLLQAESSFLLPLLWTVIGNAGIVVCLLLFSNRLGIHAWTLGETVWAFVGLVPLIPVLVRRYGLFRSADLAHIDWPALRQFAVLLLPLILAGGVSSMNVVVDRWVASRLPVGSISAINYATRVWTIPISLLAGPIATAIFPSLSTLAADPGRRRDLDNRIRHTVSFIAWLVLPCIAGLLMLAHPVVRLLFQRGAFTKQATAVTTACVQMYVLGLLGQALMPILQRVFYAFKDTVTPLLVGMGIVAANMAGNILLSRVLGAAGIALATSITVTLGCILYGTLMRRFFRGSPKSTPSYPLLHELDKTLLATLPVLLIAAAGRAWAEAPAAVLSEVLRTALLIIVSAFAYAAGSILLRTDGWGMLQRRIQGRAHSRG